VTISRQQCLERDRSNPYAPARARFALPEGTIYLDGNSLGAPPGATAARLSAVVTKEWRTDLITSWNKHEWHTSPQRVGGKIARLIGAQPHEVVAADSTSVNLFKVLVAAARLRPDRRVIVTEAANFPTDTYLVQSVAELLGLDIRMVERHHLGEAIGDDTAIVTATHVDYRSGALLDLRRLTEQAHAAGSLVVWDLSHSSGVVPVHLDTDDVDFAVGCGYKYLNGGPGAPAFAFVAERLIGSVRQPLTGWHGHADPFAMTNDYEPAPGIDRLLVGTAPVLGMAALEEGINAYDGIDVDVLREISMSLTQTFIGLVDERLGGHGFEVFSPRDPFGRGSQVALAHEHAYPIVQCLVDRGVIGDFRRPNLLRFGFAPLYIRHIDVYDAVDILANVMAEQAWDRPEFHARKTVT
jgi:kynureninase